MIILFNAKWGIRMYIGSSYAQDGLKRRIWKNHKNHTHRAHDLASIWPKFLYQLMADEGTIARYVGLAVFESHVAKEQVLIAEAIFCCIFGSYNTTVYREARLSILPALLNPCWSVNRSDPLGAPWKTMNPYGISFYQSTLDNALAGGPQNISMTETKKTANCSPAFRFTVLNLKFSVPVKIAKEWNLKQSPWVSAHFEILDSPHPNQYAVNARAPDDGSRLGIKISRIINGNTVTHWVQKPARNGSDLPTREANSLVDWLSGKIENPDAYVWPADRVQFFGVNNFKNAFASHKRKRADSEEEDDNAGGIGPGEKGWILDLPMHSHSPIFDFIVPDYFNNFLRAIEAEQ